MTGGDENLQPATLGPASEVVEVNVFGPGYGESVLVHLGEDRWPIVDSCSEAKGDTPAALQYLARIGRDPAQVVKYLVATHWHDDHVRGFSRQVADCPAAKVWLTPALTYETLMTFIETTGFEPAGGVAELAATLQALRGAGSPRNPERQWQFAYEHSAIHFPGLHPPGWDGEIWALSPSSRNAKEAAREIRQLIPTDERYGRDLGDTQHNHTSIVLHVRVGQQVMLLGGDRERVTGHGRGWSSVLDAWTNRQLDTGTVLKVAHHGSKTATIRVSGQHS